MKKHQKAGKAQKKGFTLVELSLALIFVGTLFIMIATIVANMITIYQKGTTITNVNNVGRSIITDMTNAITEAPPLNVASACGELLPAAVDACKNDGAKLTVSVTKRNYVAGASGNVSTSGAFCTGKYSYIWNSGYVMLKEENGSEAAYTGGRTYASRIIYNGGAIDNNFRLIKIEDKKRLACASQVTGGYAVNNTNTVFDLTGNDPISEEPVELIASSDKRLALYQLDVENAAQNQTTKRSLYSATFILATIRGGINITGNENYCKPPGDADSDFDYCAINKFNFATRTAGE